MRFSIVDYILRPSRKQLLQDLQVKRQIVESRDNRIDELLAELSTAEARLRVERELHAETRCKFKEYGRKIGTAMRSLTCEFAEELGVAGVGYRAPIFIVDDDPPRNEGIGDAAKVIPGGGNVSGL